MYLAHNLLNSLFAYTYKGKYYKTIVCYHKIKKELYKNKALYLDSYVLNLYLRLYIAPDNDCFIYIYIT